MGCLMEFFRVSNTILYENEFQNPQIFQQTISLFPEQSTLIVRRVGRKREICYKHNAQCIGVFF
jgi:hypothetical protein